MRDLNRLLLAEDERELAHGLREVLETVGGFEVWITWLGADVIRLLKKTHAAWLVLDLELEDGYSGRVVQDVGERGQAGRGGAGAVIGYLSFARLSASASMALSNSCLSSGDNGVFNKRFRCFSSPCR